MSKIAIVTYGRLFASSAIAKNMLKEAGISVKVIKLNKIKPISPKAAREVMNCSHVFFYEEGEKFVLDLVGFFEDEYKEQVETLEQRGVAVFHGFTEDPKPYYGGADCVVMPSYHEGMSNVLLEAAAIGRPVITSDIPGCREAVEDGRSGMLVEVRSSESLYGAMKQMLKFSREERMAMGVTGCQKMVREFDKRTIVVETVKALGL